MTAAEVPVKVPVRLAAVVGAPGEPPHTVTLGQLVKGTHEYRAPVPACTAGCRLVGLAVGRATVSTDPLTVALSVDAIRTGTSTLAAGFDQAGRWRTAAGGATVHAGPALTVNVSSTDPADAIVDYLDSPDRLPAVVAGRVPADDEHAATFQFPGFAEQPQPFAVAAHAAALPRAGAHGLLFDLDYAVRSAERTSSLADNNTLRYEVWAGPDAPADLERRLTGAGLEVVRAESVTGTVDQLSRRAPALGLWLYLLAGAAALLLAVGVVLLTAYVGVQGRLYELAALRVAGVRARILRRAVLGEYRLLLGAPLLVGFVAGVAGALVMLPGIPLVTAGTPTGTVSWRPGPSGALPVAAAATVVGLALAVLVVLRLLHRATPERLREGTR